MKRDELKDLWERAGDGLRFEYDYSFGCYVPGEGVSIGVYNSPHLAHEFNVFAMRHDILDDDGKTSALLYWPGAIDAVAALEDVEGHDGLGLAHGALLDSMLADGDYKGQWIVPTGEILSKMILPHYNTGALRGTFVHAAKAQVTEGLMFPGTYWSCTQKSGDKERVQILELPIGGKTPSAPFPLVAGVLRHCRAVRLSPRM